MSSPHIDTCLHRTRTPFTRGLEASEVACSLCTERLMAEICISKMELMGKHVGRHLMKTSFGHSRIVSATGRHDSPHAALPKCHCLCKLS
ncbi:hypothetical protein AAFF_G00089400 [Aldrovandia affinis]|uniref:Uncharacterized protein n=1 Tax=Aldrovandia affinis TaxID=143900 RepID=A0AAD7WBX4_9TELE|nr:hypothetical protein AAFF_G00089400 [Aldrovandia affinis]